MLMNQETIKSAKKIISRRDFLKDTFIIGGSLFAWGLLDSPERAFAQDLSGWPDRFGMLTDITRCIGCRRCEEACNKANNLPAPEVPFEDKSVFEKERRTDAKTYTVVNRYANPKTGEPDALLEVGGDYHVRHGGRRHLWTSEAIYKHQQATRNDDYETFKQYTALIDDQSAGHVTLRSLFTFAETQPDTNYTAVFVSTDSLCRGQMITDKTTSGFRAVCGGNFANVTIDWAVVR